MATVSIRLEESEKKALDSLLSEMGMNISTFYSVYTKRALRERRIPFAIEAPIDPFYSGSNMKALGNSVQQAKSGKTVERTLDELEDMAISEIRSR